MFAKPRCTQPTALGQRAIKLKLVETFPPRISNAVDLTLVRTCPRNYTLRRRASFRSKGEERKTTTTLSLSLSLSRPLRSTPILALRSWGKCSREPRNSARFLLLDSRAGRKTVPPAPRPIPHKAARPQRQPIRLPLVSKGAESQWEVAARAELLFVAPAPSLPPSAFHSAPGGGSEIRGPM